MLKITSLAIENNKIRVAYPVLGGFEDIEIYPRPEQEHTYTQNNGVVSFLDRGKVFVTPYSRRRIEALREEGFQEGGNLWVPFSNGDVPADGLLAKVWEQLKYEADRERIQDFENACAKIAKAKGVKFLDETWLQEHCVHVPEEGLEMQKYERDVYRHLPAFSAFEPFDEEKIYRAIGTYTTNNGVVAFIDHRGREYIMPGFDQLETLEQAGYSGYSILWVAMSNGGRFVDDYLQHKWQSMKKIADAAYLGE